MPNSLQLQRHTPPTVLKLHIHQIFHWIFVLAYSCHELWAFKVLFIFKPELRSRGNLVDLSFWNWCNQFSHKWSLSIVISKAKNLHYMYQKQNTYHLGPKKCMSTSVNKPKFFTQKNTINHLQQFISFSHGVWYSSMGWDKCIKIR